MKRGHRCEATAAHRRDALPLRLDATPRLGVVQRLHQLLLSDAHLQRERALACLGQQLLGSEAPADLVAEPEPVEAARGKHNRVEPALDALAQARVDVAAQRLDRQLGHEREQLRAPAHRRRADAHARPQLTRAAERVTRVLALEVRADRETVRIGRRHVLGRMHGDVDPPLEQRLLELLDEDTARADLAERLRAVAIARGRDRHERDLQARHDAGVRRRGRPE